MPIITPAQITHLLETLPDKRTNTVRNLRKELSKQIKDTSPDKLLNLANELVKIEGRHHRFIAYELVYFHKPTRLSLGIKEVEALGYGMSSWYDVDEFGSHISGPAWQKQQIGDPDIWQWARSDNVWWRRAALVSTTMLNKKSRGGQGDVGRTLGVCDLLVADHEDMVVKAMSWALRELIPWDPDSVEVFILTHDKVLAARVKREVRNKLETGLKNPRK